MKQPIKYTIENINGIHEISDYFDINDNLLYIRITAIFPFIQNGGNYVMNVINEFSVNGIEVLWKTFFSANGSPLYILDLPIDIFLKSTRDLNIKIIKNSKIEVNLFFQKPRGEFSERPSSLPYYIKTK